MGLTHSLQLNIQLGNLYQLVQYCMILQLKHTDLITQSLKEIRNGNETGLKDTALKCQGALFHKKNEG